MDLDDLLLLASRVSIKGGEKILEVYETAFDVELKADESPLTLADKGSHDLIVDGLASSSYPVISEEGRELEYSLRKNMKRFWCADPLDGTKEFIKRNGEFTVNIALIENNSPILGVIYIPVLDVLYAAGEGTLYRVEEARKRFTEARFNFIDYAVRSPNKVGDKNPVRVLTSRSHLSEETKSYLHELEAKNKKIEYVSAGSALKFCLLAEGKADLYPRFGPTMEWDTAAGHALLKAVGKNILSYPSGLELKYNKINLVNDWFIAG